MDSTSEWPQDQNQVLFDACDSSSNGSTNQSSVTQSMTTSTSSSTRSTRSQHSQQVINTTSIVPSDARNGGLSYPTLNIGSNEQEGPMLISPPADDQEIAEAVPHCTGCKSASPAVANCFSCASLLCANCVIAHQLMVAFEGHHVTNLGQGKPTIKEQCQSQGQAGNIDNVRKMVKDAKKKLNELHKIIKSVDYSSSRLSSQYEKATGEVTETFNFYMSMLAERKLDVTKEIEKLYSTKQVALSVYGQKIHESTDKIEQMVAFTEKLLQSASTKDVLLFQNSLETRMQYLVSSLPQLDLANTVQLEFISNFQAIQVGVRNQFGYIKSGSDKGVSLAKQPPISRPTPTIPASLPSAPVKPVNSVMSGLSASTTFSSLANGTSAFNALSCLDFQNNSMAFGQVDVNLQGLQPSPLDILENLNLIASGSSMVTPNSDALTTITGSVPMSVGPAASLATPVPSAPIVYPPKAQIRRQKMIYHCKFGEFGILEGQFTEPSGVAVTEENEIIVADTNNHRIQVFDKEGNFKFQFGEVGKRDGQLLYPNRVAVVATSGDIVVTERSPTHQVQIFTKFGHFIRKFGADILQHPRGVTTDCWGRIIVVECKVMRVVIFDMMGNVLNKFSCSRYLEFPNGVVVNDQMEIFISDNRAHCVKVFDYQGNYLRQIGGEGVSNFPIGVGLTASGEITIADNHNNFNLTVFSQAGQLLGALESKVKHAQCFDVALMKDGSIVLASKDYRLYIYRYVKIPALSM